MRNWVFHIMIAGCLDVQGQTNVTVGKDTAFYKDLDQFVVTASRRPESLLRTPASVLSIPGDRLRNHSAFSLIDGLQGIRGIHIITPSLGFKVINSRGFANTTNVRFVQLVDGMDVQSPHIGSPVANAMGPTDLDIKNAEFVMGIASALYGMNAINGLISFQSKNPFTSQGLSFQQKTGINHTGSSSIGTRLFSETSIRYAHVFSSRIAFKTDFSLVRGMDWMANDTFDLGNSLNASTGFSGANNPSKDPVNGYGNESPNRRVLLLDGRSYVIARSGYMEKEVVDYRLSQVKWGGAIHYRTRKGNEWQLNTRIVLLNNIYQRSNRFKLDDYLLQQYGLSYVSPAFNFRIYTNRENSGNSFNLRSMAENLDRHNKKDDEWFREYATSFLLSRASGNSVDLSHIQGRSAADAGRLAPGTEMYREIFTKLRKVNNWDSGAALSVKAAFVHAEWTFSLTQKWLKWVYDQMGTEILVGGDHRIYVIQPDGNYFINPIALKQNSPLRYGRYGLFLSSVTRLYKDKLSLGFVLRGDKYDYFHFRINPRVSLVYRPLANHSFRVMYQTGYRYPSIFEGFSNINSGGVKRIGGLPVMSSGIFERAWLQSSISAFQSAVINDMNQSGLSKNAAIERNKNVLKQSPYTYIRPEFVRSLEAGYQCMLWDGGLILQADMYVNRYRDFIAQVNVGVPVRDLADSIAYFLFDKEGNRPYRLWTNSHSVVTNLGGSIGVTWKNHKGLSVHGNMNIAKLVRKVDSDGLEDGFNTSPLMVNITVAHEELFNNFSGGMSVHWQKKYLWQSFLVDGMVPSFATADIFLGVRLPSFDWRLRVGASNAFNRKYVTYLGGPQVGALYYITATYGLSN